jgi:hypothetical protein
VAGPNGRHGKETAHLGVRPARGRPRDTEPLTVRDVESGNGEASARLELEGRVHVVTLRSSGGTVAGNPDPFLALALAPAMAAGRPLRVEGEVSPVLLAAIPRIQRMLHWGYPELTEVPVQARSRDEALGARASGVGAFFSGGLDSFYTVLKRRNDFTHLIFVDGFDTPPGYQRRRAQVAESVRRAASELGKPLIEVETDHREFVTDYVALWPAHYGAIAAAAYLLSSQLGRIYRPGSTNYAEYAFAASGSLDHLVTPLWSTDRVDLVYDGFEASRCDKAVLLAQNDVALRWLRVCQTRDAEGLNCGHCEKCLRTMLNLWAAGSLDGCATLPRRLDLDAISRLRVGPRQIECWQEILRAVQASRPDRDVIGAVRRVLGRSTGARRSLIKLRRRLIHLASAPLRAGRRDTALEPSTRPR